MLFLHHKNNRPKRSYLLLKKIYFFLILRLNFFTLKAILTPTHATNSVGATPSIAVLRERLAPINPKKNHALCLVKVKHSCTPKKRDTSDKIRREPIKFKINFKFISSV